MTKICPNCKTENPNNAEFCQNCGNNLQDSVETGEKTKGGFTDWWNKRSTGGKALLGLVGICCVGLIFIVAIGGMFSSDKNTSTTTQSSTPAAPAESESQFKSSCQSIDYAVFNKNPNKYIGQKLKFTGEIFQIQEDSSGTFMLLDVTGSGDRIAVYYKGQTSASIVEGKTVTVYGTGLGSYTYTSQANYKITVPSLDAKYIDIAS